MKHFSMLYNINHWCLIFFNEDDLLCMFNTKIVFSAIVIQNVIFCSGVGVQIFWFINVLYAVRTGRNTNLFLDEQWI